MPRNNEKKPVRKAPSKAPYEKPAIHSEPLTAVAALCNGTAVGGRKATTPVCASNKLKS